jgi:hypothetical protein
MNTLFWGPSAWQLIHSIGLIYPKNSTDIERQIFYDFFDSLQYVLPCKHCRKSYSMFYKDIDFNNLFNWTWKLHNRVNDKLRIQGLIKNNKNPLLTDSLKFHKNKLHEARKNNNFPGLDFINCVFMDCKNNMKKKYFLESFKKLGKYLKIPIVDIYCQMGCNLTKESQFKNINMCKDVCLLKGLPTSQKYDIKEYLDFYNKFIANCGAVTCR